MNTHFEAQFEWFWAHVFQAAFEMAVDVGPDMTRAQWAGVQADQALAELRARRVLWVAEASPP